jgi:hypothetical protein
MFTVQCSSHEISSRTLLESRTADVLDTIYRFDTPIIESFSEDESIRIAGHNVAERNENWM